MLLRMALLHATLHHLLHEHISINGNLLFQRAIDNPPHAADCEGADWWLCVDEVVDAVGLVCECQFEGTVWES